MAGVHAVSVQGLNTGTLDLSINGWGHQVNITELIMESALMEERRRRSRFNKYLFWKILQVGLMGEKLHVFTQGGSHRVQWTKAKGAGPPLTWYKVLSSTRFKVFSKTIIMQRMYCLIV